jgi:hypothetical protein
MNRHPPSNQQLHEIKIAPLWQEGLTLSRKKFPFLKKRITRGFSLRSTDAILIFQRNWAWRKKSFHPG